MAAQNGSSFEKQVIVAMIPLAAQGHLNQLLHLSRLISAYDIPVHYITTTTHIRQAKVRVHGWDPLAHSNIHFHELPVPSPDSNTSTTTKLSSHLFPSLQSSLQLRQPIAAILRDLSNTAKRLIVIHDDLTTYHVQDVPTILNAESYCFYSISVFSLYTYIWELFGKPNVPEFELLFKDLPSNESCFTPEFTEYMKLHRDFKYFNSGNLYNTCREIEGHYLDLVAQALGSKIDKHWAIGPFNPLVLNAENPSPSPCLEWLNGQPLNSVIFVSFGTTTSFSDEEIKEIADGLEKSGQKFIWVLRDADKADIFTGEDQDRRAKLPKGYEERIEGRGMIIRDWAPQLEILGHPSIGGFMSHCGWNSTIESISFGVPIAAWPIHSDQPRNAMLVTQLLKIGIAVRDWMHGDAVVTSETIENVVRRLMDTSEGEEMRKRAAKLSEDAKKSMEGGGHSHMEMESFIAHIRR